MLLSDIYSSFTSENLHLHNGKKTLSQKLQEWLVTNLKELEGNIRT